MAKFVKGTAGPEQTVVWVNLDLVRSMVRTPQGTRLRMTAAEQDLIYLHQTPEQLLGMPAESGGFEQSVEMPEDAASAI